MIERPYVSGEPRGTFAIELDGRAIGYQYFQVGKIDYIFPSGDEGELIDINIGKEVIAITGQRLRNLFEVLLSQTCERISIGGDEKSPTEVVVSSITIQEGEESADPAAPEGDEDY